MRSVIISFLMYNCELKEKNRMTATFGLEVTVEFPHEKVDLLVLSMLEENGNYY